MATKTRHEILGEWSGYYSRQRRPVHREITTDQRLVDAVRKLGCITYTDGTRLVLSVRPLAFGERRQPDILGYKDLIRQCIREGKDRVEQLSDMRERAVRA